MATRRVRARFGPGLGLCAAVFLLVGSLPLQAEEGGEDPAPRASAPQPIEIARILVEARNAESKLDSIAEAMESDVPSASFEAELERADEAIVRQREREKTLLDSPTLEQVEDLESEWRTILEGLPSRAETLERRAEDLAGLSSDLARLREVWEASLASAESEGAPATALSRTRAIIERVDALDERLAVEEEAVLSTQAALSDRIVEIEEGIERLDDLNSQLVRRIFERDQDPIWATASAEDLPTTIREQIDLAIESGKGELDAFLVDERGRIPVHLVGMALLYWLLRTARRRVRARSEEEAALGRVAEMFELPFATAILIGLLAAPFFYGHVPSFTAQVIGLGALVPTILILRRFTPTSLHPLLTALVFFYIADRVMDATVAVPLVARMIFLLEMVVAVVFLAWLLRPARLAGIPQWAARSFLLRTLGIVSNIALGAFGIALVGEVLGYSRLAQLLGGGALESAYIGVIVYAALRIAESLVTLLLRIRPLALLRMVQRERALIRRRAHRTIRVASFLFWLVFSLDRLALWTPITDSLGAIVGANARVGTIDFSLGDVLAFVLTVAAAVYFSRFARFVLEEDVYPRLRLSRGVPYAISTFLHYGILLLGFVLAVAAMGIDLDRFAILAGAFGVGIGFGLQNVVNNFASGLILLTERPIQVGDTIDTGDALGDVVRIGIRSSTVRTWDGAELIVPNAQLISERVTNWTLSDRQRRIDVPVGVAYGTDRARVMELLRGVGEANSDVMSDPAPVALFSGFGDSSLDFVLRVWTSDSTRIAVIKSDLAMAIGDALADANIEIPFPQRDLHVRSVSSGVTFTTGSPGPEDEGA